MSLTNIQRIAATADSSTPITMAGSGNGRLLVATFHQFRNPANITNVSVDGEPGTVVGLSTSGTSRCGISYWLDDDLPEDGGTYAVTTGTSSSAVHLFYAENAPQEVADIFSASLSSDGDDRYIELADADGDYVKIGAFNSANISSALDGSHTSLTYGSPVRAAFINEGSAERVGYTSDGSSPTTQIAAAFLATGSSPVAPVITDPSPTGTLLTPRTATIEVATDTAGGTMYLVVDEASLTGIDDEDIEGGFLPDGTTEAFIAESKAVTDGLVQFDVEGLDPDTAYNYALVQKVGSLYSNVEVGSFTTAEVTTGVMLVGEDRITLPGSDDLLSEEGLHVTVWDGRPGDSESTIIVDTTADIIDGELILEVSAVTLEDPIHVLIENADLSIFARYSGTIVEVPTVGET